MADVFDQVNPIPEDWWTDHSQVMYAARLMEEFSLFLDREAVLDFFEKPYNYTAEYREALELNRAINGRDW